MSNVEQIEAVHPGCIIWEEICDRLDVSPLMRDYLLSVINGDDGVDAELADDLAIVLGTSAVLWRTLQGNYDAAMAERAKGEAR